MNAAFCLAVLRRKRLTGSHRTQPKWHDSTVHFTVIDSNGLPKGLTSQLRRSTNTSLRQQKHTKFSHALCLDLSGQL